MHLLKLLVEAWLCVSLISPSWLREPCCVCMFLCIWLGMLVDVCPEVFWVLDVKVTCISYLYYSCVKMADKSKEGVSVVYNSWRFSLLCSKVRKKECEEV